MPTKSTKIVTKPTNYFNSNGHCNKNELCTKQIDGVNSLHVFGLWIGVGVSHFPKFILKQSERPEQEKIYRTHTHTTHSVDSNKKKRAEHTHKPYNL